MAFCFHRRALLSQAKGGEEIKKPNIPNPNFKPSVLKRKEAKIG